MSDQADNGDDDLKPPPGAQRPKAPVRKAANRRKFIRTAALTCGVVGLSLAGWMPVGLCTEKRLRPPGTGRARLPLLVHQVRAMRAGLSGGSDQAGRHRRRLRHRRALHRRPRAGLRFFPATPCSASCLSDRRADLQEAGIPQAARRHEDGEGSGAQGESQDAEPTLNLKERIGVARLARPDACLAVKGEGLQGAGAWRCLQGAHALHGCRPLEARPGQGSSV